MTSRAGLVVLDEVAAGTGLADGLTAAFERLPHRTHRPGRSILAALLALADGAECVADIAAYANQPAMFGHLPSEATLWRTFNAAAATELRGLADACRDARATAWAGGAGPHGEELVIDIDATIITTRSDKQDAAGTYKHSWGHYPLLAMAGDLGEVLALQMRPGNSGSATSVDHVELLGEAIEALPETWAQGHRSGDHRDDPAKELIVRTDAGGISRWLVEECRDRNCRFVMGLPIDAAIREAVCCVDDSEWLPATDNAGAAHRGAEVTEITHLLNLSSWDGYDHEPPARVIVRRERPHPGAQLTLFDTIEGQRHRALITDLDHDNIAELEALYRNRARAENTIADTKATGLAKLPFDSIVANTLWAHLAAMANNLIRWVCAIGFTGTLAKARPKTIRHRILHVAGHITASGRRLRIDRTWRWTRHILDALHRIRHTLTTTQREPQPHPWRTHAYAI